jgi:hypothetical protein
LLTPVFLLDKNVYAAYTVIKEVISVQMTVLSFRVREEVKEHYEKLAKEYEHLDVKPSTLIRLDIERCMRERQEAGHDERNVAG